MQVKRMNDPSGVSAVIDIPVEGDSYVQRILTENEIPGLCRLRIKSTDGEKRFCFQIGKAESLLEAAERSGCSRSTLRRALETLVLLREELEDYLIEADCLLMEPELIFLAEADSVRFCACPGRSEPLRETLPKLINWFWEASQTGGGEEMLPAEWLGDPRKGLTGSLPFEQAGSGLPGWADGLTAQQRDALLALCASPEPDLKKMIELLQEPEPEKRAEPEETDKSRQAALPNWVKKGRKKTARKERRRKGLRVMGRIGSLLMPLVGIGVEALLWKSGLLADFSRWLQAGIYGVTALFFAMMTLLLRESENRKMISAEEALDLLPPPDGEELPQIRIEDTLEYDPDELEAAAVILERGETVLLSELMIAGSALGILISRQPEQRPNIYVTASPFRIGKEGSGADAEPASRYMSRDHALIEATESGCRLRDEGSTNGTFVNGDRLLPGQWTELSDGDDVRFADAPYRYRQGCGER